MQAQLGQLIERLYQLNVRYDDELQNLTCRALDDIQALRLLVAREHRAEVIRHLSLSQFPHLIGLRSKST